jgi:uncharacterized phiE125 gp8 family phage protein
MKRAIIVPPAPWPEALDALRQWLAITSPREDDLLTALIASALDLCEAFTGTMPLEATCEELIGPGTDWQALATRPVQAIVAVEGVAADGSRTILPGDAYALDLEPDGGGRVRIASSAGAPRFAVRFVAGLAPTWTGLPESLRQGVIRLAAHQYRQRDGAAANDAPPAAVAALWRPWRRIRLG